MSALPAFSASSRRIGSARALSACVCVSEPVSDSVWTSISLPVEHRRLDLDRRERGGDERALGGQRAGRVRPRRRRRAPRRRGAQGRLRVGAASAAACRRRRAARTTTTVTTRAARTARIHSANRSVMTWRRGTPARRRLAPVAVRHLRRAADVDVAQRDVGHEPLQVLGGQQLGGPGPAVVAEHVVDLDAAPLRELLELHAQDHVVLAHRPVDERDVAGVAGQVLQQRADRRDADAARDQRDPRAPPRGGGEGAVRPVEDHPRAGRDRAQPEVADLLDRDPQPPPVGRGGERVRVRLPPVLAGQEAPGEELAGARLQLARAGRRRSRARRRPAPPRSPARPAAGGARCAARAPRAGTRTTAASVAM